MITGEVPDERERPVLVVQLNESGSPLGSKVGLASNSMGCPITTRVPDGGDTMSITGRKLVSTVTSRVIVLVTLKDTTAWYFPFDTRKVWGLRSSRLSLVAM